MLKKILSFLILPILLCSCSSKNYEEITFSSWGSITEVQILKKIISDFEKENPNIKVNFIHIPQNYFQKLHLLFASNQAPDVIFINNLYLPLYAKQLKEIHLEKEKFFPQSLQALSYENKLYAFPRDISNFVFYYNKNLVTIPSVWNFKNFTKTLETSGGQYKISYEKDIFWAQPYILTLGFNEGLEFYKNLEGKLAPIPAEIGSSTLGQMFLDQKIAFYLSGRWMYPKIKESTTFPWGIIEFPGIVPADASGWAISKTTKHFKSAEKFATYLCSKKSINYFTKTGLITPALIESTENMENKEIFLKSIYNSKALKIEKNYKHERDIINKKLFN